MRKIAVVLVLLWAANVQAVTIQEAHQEALEAVSAEFGQHKFHLAQDSWLGNDKFFDHGAFAFVLAQITEDVFRPGTDTERGLAFTLNMMPWVFKEVIDGYSLEGASYKDAVWSAAGALVALLVH